MIDHFLLTVLVAMVPVLELRGAIPIGIAHDLTFWEAFSAGVIGNCIPVPFIILFVRKVFAFLRRHSSHFERILSYCEKRADDKAGLIHKYKLLGLMILVAIPLPGTGAWTGALVAATLDIRLSRAFPAIVLGVILAGIIVSLITYGTSIFLF